MDDGQKTNAKGFTIIEVVLVLAIAGLIFLVVFLALPALQRSQRDTQRRADASRAMSQIAAYQSNKQGNVPASQAELVTNASSFKNDYLTNGGQSFKDPYTGSDYNLQYQALLTTAVSAVGDMFYYTNAKCDSTAASGVVAGSGSRNVSIVTKVEQGGNYCVNN